MTAVRKDWTGSLTGYGEVNADRYITADLQGGRLPELIDAGQPAVQCSHWQGFYGLHDGDRAGFEAFKTVVERLRERDPAGEQTAWRTCSEITNYACARELASVDVGGDVIDLDLPITVPEITMTISAPGARRVSVDGRPLEVVSSRRAFSSGTCLLSDEGAMVAFDPQGRRVRVEVFFN